MKTTIVLLFGTLLLFAGCAKESPTTAALSGEELFSESAFIAEDDNVTSSLPWDQATATDSLSPAEAEGLIFMREEEKVARDVYIKMAEKWNLRIFQNISRSEQAHMNALKFLLTRYNITDPVGSNGIGVFTNPELQSLYNALLARGSQSSTEALKVGKDIELADIADLEHQLQSVAVNTQLRRVYTNLNRASHFHLRAFQYWLQPSSK